MLKDQADSGLILQNNIRLIYKLSALMFAILLNANLLRSVKDSIVPLALGAEALSFVRIYIELPVLCILICAYRVCIKHFSQKAIFRCIIFCYLVTVMWFAYYVSHNEVAPPVKVLTKLETCFHYRTYSAIYVLFDMWPMLAYMNFYWELSNRIFSVAEAKTIYPRYYLIGQANLLFSGAMIICISLFDTTNLFSQAQDSKLLLVILVCINFIIIERLYTNLSQYARQGVCRLAALDISVSQMLRCKFFKYLFLSLLSYTATICIIEIMFLHHLKILYPNINDLILGLCCKYRVMELKSDLRL